MSKENNLDQGRVDRMIKAYLGGQMLAAIQQMADRFGEAVDALAAFLVGDRPTWDDDVEFPCSQEQWEFFLGRARHATQGRLGQDIKKEDLPTYARVGGWADRIPTEYRAYGKDLYELGYETAWAWAWSQDKGAVAEFFGGRVPYLKLHKLGQHGFVVAEGLVVALREGLIVPPAPEQVVPFIIAFGRWSTEGVNCSGVGALAHALGISGKISEMSEADLQALAGVWHLAAEELGRRRVPLAVPLLQDRYSWITAVFKGIKVSKDPAAAAEEYIVGDQVIRWLVHLKAWLAVNPADPFGPEVCRMRTLLKERGYEVPRQGERFPTYEECLRHIS